MRPRLSRAERKQQTRAELLAAAQRVFLRDGFHGASMSEIAEDAGYTFGAVYSNFQNKDDLFLAVVDAEEQRRVPLHVDFLLDAPSLEEGLRASAREYAQYAQEHPDWTAVYVEFWTHASRRPELRREVAERHERLIETVTGLVEEFARRWGGGVQVPGQGGGARHLRAESRRGAGAAGGPGGHPAGPVRGDVHGLRDGRDSTARRGRRDRRAIGQRKKGALT